MHIIIYYIERDDDDRMEAGGEVGESFVNEREEIMEKRSSNVQMKI